MTNFSKQSLETLRDKIDLVDVISSHIQLKRYGAFFKALCPFHEEKSPSFVVRPGDSHYHCYGCGAHGDAMAFLMHHLNIGFIEAVENLAERFHVHIEKDSAFYSNEPEKRELKDALEIACQLFSFCLLHTNMGQKALVYLYERGIPLDFIRKFRIGYAPSHPFLFHRYMKEKKINEPILKAAGLITDSKRDFFSDRIVFPIQDAMGAVIGFSARKFSEKTFGPKYINTPETRLFKKSKILFGLNFCRRQIVKEKKALLVEGQVDALKLIDSGISYTVASQGTAMGAAHISELVKLGVKIIFIAFDSDEAGQKAAIKTGDLFQKEGIDVRVVQMPKNSDPDSILQEKGKDFFEELIEKSLDYLTFLIRVKSQGVELGSPAQKHNFVNSIADQIRQWDHPLMVHESLKKLASITKTPENMLSFPIQYREKSSVQLLSINPDQILESDLLRWLLLMGESNPNFFEITNKNIQPEHFKQAYTREIFSRLFSYFEQKKCIDLLDFAISLEESQRPFLEKLLSKKIDENNAEDLFIATVQKMLDRSWMEKRQQIQLKIQSGTSSEKELVELAKQFDAIKKDRPKICYPE